MNSISESTAPRKVTIYSASNRGILRRGPCPEQCAPGELRACEECDFCAGDRDGQGFGCFSPTLCTTCNGSGLTNIEVCRQCLAPVADGCQDSCPAIAPITITLTPKAARDLAHWLGDAIADPDFDSEALSLLSQIDPLFAARIRASYKH